MLFSLLKLIFISLNIGEVFQLVNGSNYIAAHFPTYANSIIPGSFFGYASPKPPGIN